MGLFHRRKPVHEPFARLRREPHDNGLWEGCCNCDYVGPPTSEHQALNDARQHARRANHNERKTK